MQELYSLYRQHRYQQVIEGCDKYSPTDPFYYPVQLLKLRALNTAGLLKRAYQQSEKWVAQSIPSDKWRACFQMWHQFFSLHYNQLYDLKYLIYCFERIIQNPTADKYTIGLAYDLTGRTISTGIAVQLLSAVTHKAEAEKCWKIAAAYYKQAEAGEDYIAALKMLANSQAQRPFANQEAAKETYRQLLAFDADNTFPFTHLEARLALAEADLNALLSSADPAEPLEHARIIAVFQEAEDLFWAAQYTWGYARVPEIRGNLLLRYGNAAGESLLREAARRYQDAGAATDQQRTLRALARWYESRGEEVQFKENERAANALDAMTEFEIGRQTSLLNLVNLAYREGRLGDVLHLCDEALTNSAVTWTRQHFLYLRAKTLGTLGRKEGPAAAEQLVTFLKPYGDTPTLAIALQLWADFLSASPDLALQKQAEQAMEEAIDIDGKLGDTQGQAGRLITYSHFLLRGQQAIGNEYTLTTQLTACWEKANYLLENDNTQAGILQFNLLKQAVGQQYFMAGNQQRAEQFFAQAEGAMLASGAKGQLLFLYIYQGALEILVARAKGSQQQYQTALQLFDQAAALVVPMHLLDVHWRILLNQGICMRETGRLEETAAQRQWWWSQAEIAFQAAHRILFSLMLTADYQAGDSQHASRAGFLGERQSVYSQGFYLNLLDCKDVAQSLKWLDRMKSQALLATILSQRIRPAGDMLSPEQHDVDWGAFQQRIRAQEAALQRRIAVFVYYFTEKQQLVFCLLSGAVSPQVHTLAVPFAPLRRLKKTVFQGRSGVRRMASEEHWLCFSELISPVEQQTEPGDIVLLIPHGLLHDLPLHTLRTSTRSRLIERNPVGYQLSLGLLADSLAHDSFNGMARKAVFGDSRSNLAAAKQEAEAVARLLHVSPHIGAAASRGQFLHDFTQADIIHFAGHGKFSQQEDMEQHLVLAADEQVAARDLIGLTSSASLVVLSGCETGVSEHRSGDELFGLVRALLSAGVATVVTSQWPVDDEATQQFFAAFYKHPPTGKFGEKVLSLQRAAVQMIRQGQSFYEWGGFTLTGNL